MSDSDEEYDLGFICDLPPQKGVNRAIKVTVNRWRGVVRVHTREYYQDGDTGEWLRTTNGISVTEEHIDTWVHLLSDASELITDLWRKKVDRIVNKPDEEEIK
jgi:hypothetical protein